MPGPPPKPADQRRRTNSPATEKHTSFVQSAAGKAKEIAATHKRAELVAMAEAAGIEVVARMTKLDIAAELIAVDVDPDWHPVARAWYQSLAESGQSDFYEPSDWAVARLVAESMSRDLKPQIVGTTEDGTPIAFSRPINGASLRAYLGAFASLLVTEGDRRRARLELEKPKPDQGDTPPGADAVSILDDYRDRDRTG